MNDMIKNLGEKVVIEGGKKFVTFAINNGSKLSKKVIEVAPAGAVVGIAAGALATMILASNELCKEEDFVAEDAI